MEKKNDLNNYGIEELGFDPKVLSIDDDNYVMKQHWVAGFSKDDKDLIYDNYIEYGWIYSDNDRDVLLMDWVDPNMEHEEYCKNMFDYCKYCGQHFGMTSDEIENLLHFLFCQPWNNLFEILRIIDSDYEIYNFCKKYNFKINIYEN